MKRGKQASTAEVSVAAIDKHHLDDELQKHAKVVEDWTVALAKACRAKRAACLSAHFARFAAAA